jgi:hypothetical protein
VTFWSWIVSWYRCLSSIGLSFIRAYLITHTYIHMLRFLSHASWYTYIRRTNKMHTFFNNDLVQFYCLWHVSNNQVFIIRKTCTWNFTVFYHATISAVSNTSWQWPDWLHSCMIKHCKAASLKLNHKWKSVHVVGSSYIYQCCCVNTVSCTHVWLEQLYLTYQSSNAFCCHNSVYSKVEQSTCGANIVLWT